jgi:uncharacterized protein (TIGR00251 family)
MRGTRPARKVSQGSAAGGPLLVGATLAVSDGPDGVRFGVRVQPRAAREGLSGVREGALLIHLHAPPVGGAANTALVRLLSRSLRVAPSSVTVVHGLKGRNKVVRVAGMSASSLSRIVSATLAGSEAG